MKNFLVTAIALFVANTAFADTQTAKISDGMKNLGTAFRHHSTVAPKIDPSDITMGYAGQDVTNRTPVAVF